MPSLEHSLLNRLELEDHPNVQGIDYPTIDCNCCDLLISADHVELLLPPTRNEFRRIPGNLRVIRTCIGWIVTGNEHAMTETYHLTAPVFPDNNSQQDFDELPNDDETAPSTEDRHAMEIVDRTIKRVDEFKFQIAVPLKHISHNLPNNLLVAQIRPEQQRKSLKGKPERETKYADKITRLKKTGLYRKS